MIIEDIKNIKKYEMLIPGISKAINKIQNLEEYHEGKIPLDDGGYYMIQEGITNSSEKMLFETHKRYIDVQYLLEGAEILEWSKKGSLAVKVSYDEKRDLELYFGEEEGQIYISQGMVYIMFPEDAHKACCHIEKPTRYVKAVIKIPIK